MMNVVQEIQIDTQAGQGFFEGFFAPQTPAEQGMNYSSSKTLPKMPLQLYQSKPCH